MQTGASGWPWVASGRVRVGHFCPHGGLYQQGEGKAGQFHHTPWFSELQPTEGPREGALGAQKRAGVPAEMAIRRSTHTPAVEGAMMARKLSTWCRCAPQPPQHHHLLCVYIPSLFCSSDLSPYLTEEEC